jgi:cytochrome c
MIMRATGFTQIAGAVLVAALAVAGGMASAATGATKDEAVAMVKKAVAAIKAEGAEKAYAEINDRKGPFVDRDLYIVVYGLDGMVLAHGADAKRIGTNQIGDKDADGKPFVKERVELAKSQPSFWQEYKFMNPMTKKVEPKEMYCERLEQTVVCGGVYKS